MPAANTEFYTIGATNKHQLKAKQVFAATSQAVSVGSNFILKYLSQQCAMKTNIIQNSFRVLLGSLMVFAGISHLTFQRQEFQAQVPRWLPDNPSLMDFIVLSSGIAEITLGLAMIFLVKQKVKVGFALAIFYVLIFPGNISQYTNKIDAFGLDTDQKRFIRLFFQPILVIWALWSTGALKQLFSKPD